jgi:hypothetical protein
MTWMQFSTQVSKWATLGCFPCESWPFKLVSEYPVNVYNCLFQVKTRICWWIFDWCQKTLFVINLKKDNWDTTRFLPRWIPNTIGLQQEELYRLDWTNWTSGTRKIPKFQFTWGVIHARLCLITFAHQIITPNVEIDPRKQINQLWPNYWKPCIQHRLLNSSSRRRK